MVKKMKKKIKNKRFIHKRSRLLFKIIVIKKTTTTKNKPPIKIKGKGNISL